MTLNNESQCQGHKWRSYLVEVIMHSEYRACTGYHHGTYNKPRCNDLPKCWPQRDRQQTDGQQNCFAIRQKKKPQYNNDFNDSLVWKKQSGVGLCYVFKVLKMDGCTDRLNIYSLRATLTDSITDPPPPFYNAMADIWTIAIICTSLSTLTFDHAILGSFPSSFFSVISTAYNVHVITGIHSAIWTLKSSSL